MSIQKATAIVKEVEQQRAATAPLFAEFCEGIFATSWAFAALEVQRPEHIPSWGRSLLNLLNMDGEVTPAAIDGFLRDLSDDEIAAIKRQEPRLAYKLDAWDRLFSRLALAEYVLGLEKARMLSEMASAIVETLKAETSAPAASSRLGSLSDALQGVQVA
jgi:hypothetical protein